MARKNESSRSSLKFSGRTPSFFGAGHQARLMGGEALRRGHAVRAWAWRVALAALLLSWLLALARDRFGSAVPWPAARPLQIFASSNSFVPVASRDAKTVNVAMPVWENFFAGPLSLGEWTQRVDPQEIGVWGFIWLWLLGILMLGAWLMWARLGRWRAPRLGLCALIWLQVLAGAYYLSSFRAPVRQLETRFVAFDFHAHSTLSNGLLTPQQQIDWHRKRGFKGLAFTEADRLVPETVLQELQAANRDMILLGGSEYHGREAHLLFFGLKNPISAQKFGVPQAIREARKQNAVVIAAHPWSARVSSAQLMAWGVDGLEGWNGIVGDAALAQETKTRGLIVTGATDTASKSGADCYVWNLLPAETQTPAQVLAALRARRVAVAHALTRDETPTGLQERRAQKSPFVVWRAWREAIYKLSPAQRLGAYLQVLALVAACVWWGARDAVVIAAPAGPNSAMNFLRRRRLVLRACGALLLILAWVGSIALARVAFGGSAHDENWSAGLTPLHAILGWIMLDAGFWWGRNLWKRVH